MKKNTASKGFIIWIIIFAVLFLMLSAILILKISDSVKVRNALFVMALVVTAALVVLFVKLTYLRRLPVFVINIINAVILAGIIVLLFINLLKVTGVEQFQGNNYYAGSYESSIGDIGNDNLDECIKQVLSEEIAGQTLQDLYKYEEIYRLLRDDAVWIFFKGENRIMRLEYLIENGRYYASGNTVLIYYGLSDEADYSDEETIRKDIANSILNERMNVSGPVWGVTANKNAADMQINSVGVDYVEKISDEEGNIYYFWLIEEDFDEVKTVEDIKAITIEGME